MSRKRSFKGSVTVEASLALPIFLLGFVLILSLVQIIRTESIVQHSMNRMAVELSEYCYAADKLSLTEAIQKSNMTIGEAVENITEMSGIMDDETCDDAEGTAVITELTEFLLGDTADMGLNGPIVEKLCHTLMPKYINEDKDVADRYLEKLSGIKISDIDFRYSTILKDGKSIKLTAIYELKLNTFGFFKEKGITFTMQNTAGTAAWLTGMTRKETEEEEPEETEEEEKREPTKWDIVSVKDRGTAWIDEIQSENPGKAVASGKGIHLYESSGVFTAVHSVNVFSVSYSKYDSSLSGAQAYTLDEKGFKAVLNKYARKIKENTKNIGSEIKMEDGTVKTILTKNKKSGLIIIIPEEAKENKELYDKIIETGKKVSEEQKIEIEFTFREKAL